MLNFLKIKRVKMTLGILSMYLSMLILVACIEDDTNKNPFGECGGPRKANATDISLFYEPYKNNVFATESDTVKFGEFNVFLKLDTEFISQSSPITGFPGAAYALSCAQAFDLQNIASIVISLLEPFGGIEAGTDITDLIRVNDEQKLSELRDFSNTMAQYRLILDILPENRSQLKTKTVLKLKNGTEKLFESTSPLLLTD